MICKRSHRMRWIICVLVVSLIFLIGCSGEKKASYESVKKEFMSQQEEGLKVGELIN